MLIQKTYRVLLCTIATILIQGCASNLPESKINAVEKTGGQDALQAIYSELKNSDGKVFVLSPKLSTIRIYAFRGGSAPALGHNHVLTSPGFTGFVFIPRKGISNARFDLVFRLEQMEIDNAGDLSNLGEAFEASPSLDAIKRTRDHMLGEDNLQADRFPLVRISSVHVAGEIPKLALEMTVEMHGKQQTMLTPVNVKILSDHIVVTGAFVLRQSDFGIKPYSVLGGFLAVQNEVVIEYSLVGS